MSTLQKQIRDRALTLIQTATGLPALSLYRAPRRDIDAGDLPAILIYSHADHPVNSEDDQQRSHERAYTLRVEIRVAARIEDDATDLLASQVRHALLSDDTLGGLVWRTTWDQQQWDGVENQTPESGTALDFSFFYRYDPE